MELFKNIGIMKVTKDKLTEMILKSLNEQVEEGKLGRALAGLGLAATMATSMPSCSYFDNAPTSHYEPHWEHEGPYSEQEKQEKTWNTHNERGDWENVEPGVGFIYDCYTRCANSGGGWTIHVIFADKSTGKFILPQECREYLDGRYMPNCNCFENENTTDRVNTNGLQRLDGNENVTYLEENTNKNMKTIKLKESKLRDMIREALNELDPRTLASYAQKRQAQADGTMAPSKSQVRRGMNQQQMQTQAQQGRQGAVDAWNRDYGYVRPMKYSEIPSPGKMDVDPSWVDKDGRNTQGYKMQVADNGQYSTRWKRENPGCYASKEDFYPQATHNGKAGSNWYQASNGYSRWGQKDMADLDDGDRVAYQMQMGTGQYDKGTGKWVNEDKLTNIIKESLKKVLGSNKK